MTQSALKKLQAKWYKKLADTGFKDIENPLSKFEELRNCEGTYFQMNWTPDQFQEKQRYFELAGQMLHTHPFKKVKDRVLWEMHCNGKTPSEIALSLKMSVHQVNRKLFYYASFIKRA